MYCCSIKLIEIKLFKLAKLLMVEIVIIYRNLRKIHRKNTSSKMNF